MAMTPIDYDIEEVKDAKTKIPNIEAKYKTEIEETAKSIAQSGVIVEINTGGIARGAINDTYPSLDFLKALNKYDVPITICSDAHSVQDLDCAFDFAKNKEK